MFDFSMEIIINYHNYLYTKLITVNELSFFIKIAFISSNFLKMSSIIFLSIMTSLLNQDIYIDTKVCRASIFALFTSQNLAIYVLNTPSHIFPIRAFALNKHNKYCIVPIIEYILFPGFETL